MIKVSEALRRVNSYPVPFGELQSVAIIRGLDLESDADAALLRSSAFKLASADILTWVAEAPNVSQEGISYSFNEEQRRRLRARAAALYSEAGEESSGTGVTYGYKGSVL